jgi:hypothetical protein
MGTDRWHPITAGRPTALLLTAFVATTVLAVAANAAQTGSRWETALEADAYYTNASVSLALTRASVPRLAEGRETTIYRALLSRALVPRFVLAEVSANPLPGLGVLVRRLQPRRYHRAQLTPRFNLVQALTAGFEEPWALSLFAGGLVDFAAADSTGIAGRGYSGYLVSIGDQHIQDNVLIDDHWGEFEWKVKGDRRAPGGKLAWSFRLGTKLHGNGEIADVVYLAFRRNRIDYPPDDRGWWRNSGGEYIIDLAWSGFRPTRHHLLVDRTWPRPDHRYALALTVGLLHESAARYSGALAAGRRSTTALVIRPNVQF